MATTKTTTHVDIFWSPKSTFFCDQIEWFIQTIRQLCAHGYSLLTYIQYRCQWFCVCECVIRVCTQHIHRGFFFNILYHIFIHSDAFLFSLFFYFLYLNCLKTTYKIQLDEELCATIYIGSTIWNDRQYRTLQTIPDLNFCMPLAFTCAQLHVEWCGIILHMFLCCFCAVVTTDDAVGNAAYAPSFSIEIK